MSYLIVIVFSWFGIQLCIAGCTLEIYGLKLLYGFNDKILQNVTMDFCKKKCLLEKLQQNKVCNSLDFVMSSDTCLLSSESRLTEPGSFGEHLDAIYFEKKCENGTYDNTPLAPGDCKNNQRGALYRGHIHHTVSGRLCQAWSSQTPHSHGLKEHWKFTDMLVIRASNYCRNPSDAGPGGPWCYTTDPNVRWEYCNIPECPVYCSPFYTNPCREPPACMAHHPVYCNSDFCGGCKAVFYKANGHNKADCAAEKSPPPFTTSCLTGSGIEYRGIVNVTSGGFTCQRWDSQYPHTHSVTENQFLDLSLQSTENYCRNIGGDSERPWCYTTSSNKRWDYCVIEKCLQPADTACANSDLWAIGKNTDRIRCYKFLFDEQYHMSWYEASTYCRMNFPPKADNAAVMTQGQLGLLRVNAEGLIRECQLDNRPVPSNVTVWFAGGNLLNLKLLPQIPTLDNADQQYGLRLWPEKPQLVAVQNTDLFGVICNEV